MARPDGRAICALWAQGRRAAAHSGGPRPSRPASASLRPRSGRGPAGGPRGPGLGPALPTRRPRGLAVLAAKQRGASPAGWWGLPSAPSGRVPPAPSGLRAATPARPGRLGRRPPRPPAAVGVMWRLVAACGGSGLRPCGACQPPAVARGFPSAKQGQAPQGRACGAALLCSSPAPVAASVLRRGPAPTLWGLWGRPRLRPGRAWLRPAAPRWPACGSARAGAALPALGPPGVAAPPRSRRPAAKPRGGVRAPAGRGPCAAAIFTPRARALPALRVAALSRASRAAGARGYAACGRDSHTGAHPARPRQAACGGPCLMISGAAKGDKVTRPPVAGPPRPTNHRG